MPSLIAVDTQTGEPVLQEITLLVHMSLTPHASPAVQVALQVPLLQTFPASQLPLQHDWLTAPQEMH
jgi:hypothetical protein